MSEVKKKIDEIGNCLRNFRSEDAGLFGGLSGINLFLYHLDRQNNAELIGEQISEIVDRINEGSVLHTFCNGIGGFAWMLRYFIAEDYLDRSDCEILEAIDPFLGQKMLEDLSGGNFDYLHGGLGNALYFLSDISNNKTVGLLKVVVEQLDGLSVKEADGSRKWESGILDVHGNNKRVYNLGLSHGMASIVYFLAKAVEYEIHSAKAVAMLEGAVKYILKQRLQDRSRRSQFPSWVKEGDPADDSRLAWCYGDPGIAMVMYQAGKIAHRDEWKELATEILLHATHRRDLAAESVVDAGLCHGTAGLAQIFGRMYRYTGRSEFSDARTYWVQQTLNMARFEEGPAGYKSWQSEKYGGWVSQYGILEGIAGIGLALLSAVSDQPLNWDQSMLLS